MEDQFAAFHSWVNCLNKPLTNPGTSLLRISDAISIGDRGLVASRKIKPNQCILSITIADPRLLLTPNRAWSLLALCDCGAVDINSYNRVEPMDALVIFFLHLQLASLRCSECCILLPLWRPYLEVLPSHFTDVAFISIRQPDIYARVLSMLPSDMRFAFTKQCSRVHTAFERLFGNGRSQSQPQPHMLHNFAWAWSLVNSRCVYCKLTQEVDASTPGFPLLGQQAFKQKKYCKLSSHKPSDLAIVPFFDLFNHSPAVSVKLHIDGDCMRLSSSGGSLSGDQVFINYGDHENLFLLCEYGFCIPDGLNPSDAYFPTYSELLTVSPKISNELDHVLTELNIDIDISDQSSERVNRYWKSVFISRGGPSYFLLLILYALSFGAGEQPSANQLFLIDEEECLLLAKPIFLALTKGALAQAKVVLQQLCSILSEEGECSFIGQVVSLLRSKCLLFSSILNESVQTAKN
ncbi:unnamed protein product [Schistocephalus solidus]|uniref:SET domain-containing protein n=1 Tax=Schistocephalus solidus TaxID=70667 RepID=A0A183TLE6_SCHSO|nr:unnamed protein product [Schistocephalus solidus]